MWQILGKEDKMKKFNLKKLTVTAILAAVAVVGSLFSFPVFGSKCAPVKIAAPIPIMYIKMLTRL